MKVILVLFTVFLSGSAFAATNGYQLKLDLSIGGKHVLSPQILVTEGATASVTEEVDGEKTFIEVVATEKPTGKKNAILMKFVVGTVTSSGERRILSTPTLISLENNMAQITVENKKPKGDLTLSAIATRKNL